MKKTFRFENPPHKPPRVIEAIKRDVRKYLKRERSKALPEGVDFWDFDCRTGRDATSATKSHATEINAAVDDAAREGWPGIYIEILAKPGIRNPKPKSISEGEAAPSASILEDRA